MAKKVEKKAEDKLHIALLKFAGKTVFYFSIIMVLLYLYSYSSTGSAHFIYNGF